MQVDSQDAVPVLLADFVDGHARFWRLDAGIVDQHINRASVGSREGGQTNLCVVFDFVGLPCRTESTTNGPLGNVGNKSLAGRAVGNVDVVEAHCAKGAVAVLLLLHPLWVWEGIGVGEAGWVGGWQ